MANEWINNLKVGDEIFVSQPHGAIPLVSTVSRITKAQIFVGFKNYVGEKYEKAFWKKDGYQVGAQIYWATRLIQPTKENKKTVYVGNLKREADALIKKIVIPDDEESLLKLINAIRPFCKK
jgi:hypothetical protein